MSEDKSDRYGVIRSSANASVGGGGDPDDSDDTNTLTSDEVRVSIDLDRESLATLIDEKGDELRAELAGYDTDSVTARDGDLRVGVSPFGDIADVLGGVIKNVLPRHVNALRVTDPEDILVKSVHLEFGDKPSYIDIHIRDHE